MSISHTGVPSSRKFNFSFLSFHLHCIYYSVQVQQNYFPRTVVIGVRISSTSSTVVCITICNFENLFVGVSDSVWLPNQLHLLLTPSMAPQINRNMRERMVVRSEGEHMERLPQWLSTWSWASDTTLTRSCAEKMIHMLSETPTNKFCKRLCKRLWEKAQQSSFICVTSVYPRHSCYGHT